MSQTKLTNKQKELIQCSKYINTYWNKLSNMHQHQVISIEKFERLTKILWDWGEMLDSELKKNSSQTSEK